MVLFWRSRNQTGWVASGQASSTSSVFPAAVELMGDVRPLFWYYSSAKQGCAPIEEKYWGGRHLCSDPSSRCGRKQDRQLRSNRPVNIICTVVICFLACLCFIRRSIVRTDRADKSTQVALSITDYDMTEECDRGCALLSVEPVLHTGRRFNRANDN
jgi:hypothetical protein